MPKKRQEPVPMFKAHETAYLHGTPVRILRVTTYCRGCDRFLDEPKYHIKTMGDPAEVLTVAESKLRLEPVED